MSNFLHFKRYVKFKNKDFVEKENDKMFFLNFDMLILIYNAFFRRESPPIE